MLPRGEKRANKRVRSCSARALDVTFSRFAERQLPDPSRPTTSSRVPQPGSRTACMTLRSEDACPSWPMHTWRACSAVIATEGGRGLNPVRSTAAGATDEYVIGGRYGKCVPLWCWVLQLCGIGGKCISRWTLIDLIETPSEHYAVRHVRRAPDPARPTARPTRSLTSRPE